MKLLDNLLKRLLKLDKNKIINTELIDWVGLSITLIDSKLVAWPLNNGIGFLMTDDMVRIMLWWYHICVIVKHG